jgi:formylglycine-generating enzyme required for sulfatase activity
MARCGHLAPILAALAAAGCGGEPTPASQSSAVQADAGVLPLVEDMAEVPAGWYTAGCARVLNSRWFPYDCAERNPPRRVWVSSFEIDRLEVTRGEYRRCVLAGRCPAFREYVSDVTIEPRPALDDEIEPWVPAQVLWSHAAAFCAWRGKRLPTEAEWEKAARGTDERIYPWGDEPPTCDHGELVRDSSIPRWGYPQCPGDLMVSNDEGRPVGRFPAGASPDGLLDMYGNAGEWTLDLFPLQEHEMRGAAAYFVEERDGHMVLHHDWSSAEFSSANPSVIDPTREVHRTVHGTFAAEEDDRRLSKGDPGHSTIANRSKGTWVAPGIEIAGFRCVRRIPGPPPPDIESPPAGVFALPFREPGAPPLDPHTGRRRIPARAPR